MHNAWKAAARHWHAKMREAEGERDELLQELEELRAQPSGNPGEFAALAQRIAEADAKHPRDAEDGARYVSDATAALRAARGLLEASPTWSYALLCEYREAMVELARGDMDRLPDELLDVATVAMRWRRAVLERGKK